MTSNLPVILGGKPIRTKPYSPYPRTFGSEKEAAAKALDSDNWLSGSITRKFEEALAEYTGSRYAVAVNSGGMALQIALRGLGLEPGDEVVMKVDTCVADAFAVINAGGVPVFADTNPQTFQLDWDSVEKAISPRSRRPAISLARLV
jgi:perosamine synthetase